jgi:hypothetical protein
VTDSADKDDKFCSGLGPHEGTLEEDDDGNDDDDNNNNNNNNNNENYSKSTEGDFHRHLSVILPLLRIYMLYCK